MPYTSDIICAIFQTAYDLNFPIALWNKPNTQSVQIVISYEDILSEVDFLNVENEKGFCFQQFVNQGNKTFFIKAAIFFSTERNDFVFEDEQHKEQFLATLEKNKNIKSSNYFTKAFDNQDTAQDDYETAVKNAVQDIKEEKFQKTVVSKIKSKKLPDDFCPIQYFKTLKNSYPKAFISLVSCPQFGTWIGASPEILISINKDNILKTIALAGTQAYNNQNLSEAIWTQKEIEEQAFVSRYIINCFKKIRLREFEEIGPRTVKAGNLLHLKTEFSIDLTSVKFKNLGSTLINLLHPTSAVCGMPKTESLAFILEHEKHNRKLFCGFLGPINIEQETHIFVNLRCAEVFDSNITFYAGAGITEDSNPQKEWIETDMKCNTLLSLLS